MLQIAENIAPVAGRIEGSYEAHDGWSAMPVDPTTLQLRIFLGDPESGPLVWLFNGAPLDAESRAIREAHLRQPGAGRHLHRTPTFRIALGEQPEQMLLNNSWYGSGEYFILDANRIYTDPTGMDGFQTLLVFADRRGMHPVRNDPTAQMTSGELIAHHDQRFTPFGSGIRSLHTSDNQAIGGIALTMDGGQRHDFPVRGSVDDRSEWSGLSDGSRIAAVFLGDETGPAIIMTENAPDTIESPAARCGGDMLRVIVAGSCTIGDTINGPGSFVASETGAAIGQVRHGPEGSLQLVVLGDRRRWKPIDDSGAPVGSARITEIERVLTQFMEIPRTTSQ